jgi:acetyltransferase-like isoleucine patch superfamily enzyme
MLDRLIWVCCRRVLTSMRTKQFAAHWTSYVSKSTFEGYNSVGPRVRIVDSTIGRFSYAAQDATLVRTAIGRFCSLGPQAWIGRLDRHPLTRFATHPVFYSKRGQANVTMNSGRDFPEEVRTSLASDVWVGARSTILSGVTIATGAVVGAGALVTKDVEPYAIVGGSPARLIRYRFDKTTIERLLLSEWWNLPVSSLFQLSEQLVGASDEHALQKMVDAGTHYRFGSASAK